MNDLINQLGLRIREHPLGSGGFSYTSPSEKRTIGFRWDGAGIDRNGNVVLFEEELNVIVNLHIHGHLSRIPIMVNSGEKIKKVVWIVKQEEYKNLKKVVDDWIMFSKKYIGLVFPKMEYRTRDGDVLILNSLIR